MLNTPTKSNSGEKGFIHGPSLWECVSISSLKQRPQHIRSQEQRNPPGSALSQLSLLLYNSRSKPKSRASTFRLAYPTLISQSILPPPQDVPTGQTHLDHPCLRCSSWVILSWVELRVNLSALVSYLSCCDKTSTKATQGREDLFIYLLFCLHIQVMLHH